MKITNCYKSMTCIKPPWRNWLARSAVNRKVGGSSPPGGGFILLKFLRKKNSKKY
uniref:Uncharacterized protein n=1 Tax=Lepeophtheirus salmonis TaxID=72036 RepID=A0A0K2SZV7_LEPSM